MLQLNKNLNKKCGKCKVVKLLAFFTLRAHRCIRSHANVDSYCIMCRKLYDRNRHRANKIKAKEKNEKEKSI